MKRPLTDRDPGDETLFDVNTTLPKTCTCGVTKRNLCKWAAHRHFDGINNPQPRSCLLRYDPATAPLPEGY